MVDFTAIKERINPKTLSKFTFALIVLWIVLGGILCLAISHIQINEYTYDFRCDVIGDTLIIDVIRENCYQQYWIQNNKHGFLPHAFILLNVALIPIVTSIYHLCVKKTVKKLERRHQGDETEPRDKRRSLFIAYLCHLVVNISLKITFFSLLETQSFYPKNFPSNFSCFPKTHLVNRTQCTSLFNCITSSAVLKNVCITLTEVINGFFAFCAFVEIIYILSRARKSKKFMENRQFYFHHLEWNSQEVRQPRQEEIPFIIMGTSTCNQPINTPDFAERPENTYITMSSKYLEHVQVQNDFENALHILKENCLQHTQQPSDLKQPFQRPKHEEGRVHDLTMDEISVHVAIHEGRAQKDFARDLDRLKQFEDYPPDEKDCQFAKLEDIIDMEHKNVLVVGPPGIGKTSLSTRMLRLWASDEAFNVFHVVFLLKFGRFNDNAKLSFRELLARAETVQHLDNSVWNIIKTESTKVLLIFDGVDKYSRKEDIKAQKGDPTYKNDVEEKMPVSVLYNKLATGQLLRGASILTTTTATAVEYVAHVNFQRIVEIRGLTSQSVEDYVEKFTRDVPGAKEKMWGHIKSNINIFSLCYIPVNCFLVCSCFLQIILCESSQVLPTKITDIYKMTVNMFFSHNREGCSQKELEKLKSTRMYKPIELQEILNSLGEIAFKGIEEGRLLFESSEVSGLEDCGLLHKLPDEQPPPLSDRKRNSQFCFTHLKVQEFFAAKHLVDTMTKEKIERFVRNHINVGTWQVVLLFVAGLLKSSSSDIFIKLLPKSTEKKENPLSSEGEKLIFWPKKDKNLAVKVCKYLYEINDEQQPELQNKIEEINFNTVNFSCCSLAPIDLAAVLHFLENSENVLHINLSSNELGDLSAKDVKKFIVNRKRKLKWLNLSNNKFTDKAVEDLAEALKHSNCKLERLNLSDNKLTEAGRQDLIDARKQSDCKVII